MKLDEYLKNLDEQGVTELAEMVGTKPIYLQQLVRNQRYAGMEVAISIEVATNGAVSFEDLRPELYEKARQRISGMKRIKRKLDRIFRKRAAA